MTRYLTQTFIDIINAVQEELGIDSSDTVLINRIKRDINQVYLTEIVPQKRWPWLTDQVEVQTPAYFSTGTVSVTQNSTTLTFTESPAISYKDAMFTVSGQKEVHKVLSHTAATNTMELESPYNGSTGAAVSFKLYWNYVPLPADCRETIEVRHNYLNTPLTNVGIQEFRRVQQAGSKSQGRPNTYSTGKLVSATKYGAIGSLPASASRSSSGYLRTVVFDTTVASLIDAGDRLNITGAGHFSYNGEVVVASVSTTTITYIAETKKTETSTVDTSIVAQKLDQSISNTEYRELLYFPAIHDKKTTLYVDYILQPSPLEDDLDEPLIPLQDRSILIYGALSRQWVKHRNEQTANRNETLYSRYLTRMAGKLEDSRDSARLKFSASYLASKRRLSTSRSVMNPITPDFSSGGGAATISGTGSRVTIFNSDGEIASSDITTTELDYLDGVTSNIQVQLDAKIDDLTSTTDNAIVRTDGVTGEALQDSSIIIDDAGAITGITALTVDNILIDGNTISATSGAITITPFAGSVLNLDDSNVTVDGGVVDITGDLSIDNLNLDGNTIISTDTNGDINITPDGSGTIGVQIVYPTDNTKALQIDLDGATTAKTLTLDSNHTDDRTINFFDADDTLVGKATTDTLTNKSIDSDNNTITNIVNADIKAAAAIARSKVAAGTADYVVINDGAGALSEEAALAITRGGTGQATATEAFDALSPTTTKGDVIGTDGSDNARLAVGANDLVLTAASGETLGLKWASVASISDPEVVRNGYTHNVGITYASNILTVTQADGSALTAAGEGKIGINSVTAGQAVLLEVLNANNFFIDDGGASDIIGEEFGVITGIAWDEDRPFYLYAINEDDTSANLRFAISPDPTLTESPVTANIGYHANPMATPSDRGMFFLTSGDVTASHDEKPCVLIGGIRMQMSAADDWTVQALSTADGIRPDPYVGYTFDMVDGQMGANSGSFYKNAATIPTWQTPGNIVYKYKLGLDGMCDIEFHTSAAGNAINGSGGANPLYLITPYKVQTNFSGHEMYKIIGTYFLGGVSPTRSYIAAILANDTYIKLVESSASQIENDDFTGTSNYTAVSTRLRVF